MVGSLMVAIGFVTAVRWIAHRLKSHIRVVFVPVAFAIAAPGAVIASDVPEVVRFYLDRTTRTDLRSASLSGGGLSQNGTEQWVLVQDAHLLFENEELIKLLRTRHKPLKESASTRSTVLQVFRFPHR